MEDDERKTGWLTYLLGGLALVLLAGGIYLWNDNKALTRQHDRADQRADSMLSVRLQLENDVRKINQQLATAEVDNTELYKRVEEANRRLARNDARYRELRRANAGRTLTIEQLNRDVASLTTQRDSVGNQMEAMRGKINWLTDSNAVYQRRNEELDQEVSTLNETMRGMVPRSTLTGDGFRVEAVKKNRKETAKARKVKTLAVSLNVPAELGLSGQQEVYLSLLDEGRKAALPPVQTTTLTWPAGNETIQVHAVQSVNFGSAPQRITFRLTPDTALKPGLYRAAVYTKNNYLGAIEFRFRDSFLFF